MSARLRLRLTLFVGVLLSIPAARTYLDGARSLDSAAIRVGIAMAFALTAVSAIGALITFYAPPVTDTAIEDADLVNDAEAPDDAAAS